MKAAAIKKGHTDDRAVGFRDMGTFRCDECGELFSIVQNPLLADRWVAERQAPGSKKFLPRSTSVSRNIRPDRAALELKPPNACLETALSNARKLILFRLS
jgi:hypothetical protein